MYHGLSAKQLFLAFSKYEAGLRPGDESWAKEDQQVLDLIEKDKRGELAEDSIFEVREVILNHMREIKLKAGHVISDKSIRFNIAPKLNPKQAALLESAFQQLHDAGYLTENLALTDAGFEALYE